MFSVLLPGRPCLTDMLTISPNQFAFSFPILPHFSHIVVFMLPGNTLPQDGAAAVYLQLPGQADFRLLGAIGNEKPSAIFKVNNAESGLNVNTRGLNNAGVVSLGISVESATNINSQLSSIQSEHSTSTALMRPPPSTKVLAQRIIKNAFNFLASFSGSAGGLEVVPLKSFQDWWTKFERRIENDPGFLERDDDV